MIGRCQWCRELCHDDKCDCAATVRIAALTADHAELRDVLLRNGFVPCDIPACNCGSWHARYGLPERMQEIKDALQESGNPLSNENGNLTLNALKQLIAERDALTAEVEALKRKVHDFEITDQVSTNFALQSEVEALRSNAEIVKWAESHPEAAMDQLRVDWSMAGKGFREGYFNFLGSFREAASKEPRK